MENSFLVPGTYKCVQLWKIVDNFKEYISYTFLIKHVSS